MKSLPLFVLLATAGMTVPARAMIERTVEKSFASTGPGMLRLETTGGALKVENGPDGRVTIVAHEKIHANSDAEADALLKHLSLQFDQKGNDVSAVAHYERDGAFHLFSSPGVQVSFVATVPSAYAATLRTSGGGIVVGD